MKTSPAAIALIEKFEGMDQPYLWQGGSSGITIGYGYDLGYEPSFLHDWTGLLQITYLSRLNAAVGIKGESARAMSERFKDMKIPQAAAHTVFIDTTIPAYEMELIRNFPRSVNLPSNAFGALVSLVYNRGCSLIDPSGSDRRVEMLNISLLLKGWDLKSPLILKNIADQVQNMARLWPDDPNSDCCLHKRRLAEADLIRNDTLA